MGNEKLKDQAGIIWEISSSWERHGFANTESEPLNVDPAFHYDESSRCKIPEGAKHSYRRYYSREKAREWQPARKYSQDKELTTLMTDAVVMALQCNHEVNHSWRLAKKKEMQ